MPSNDQVVLSLQHISFHYPDATDIVSDFSLTLKQGQWISLLGQSGIGKTTLLRLICQEIQAQSGTIYSQELPAYLSQYPLLLPWLTSLENVAFAQSRHIPFSFLQKKKQQSTQNNAHLNRLLAELGLAAAKDKLPCQLSGGMAQRVAIGRTLYLDRKIWVLDEPFSKLDTLTKRQLHILIKEMAQQYQVSVILVTHDIDEAVLLSDSIYLLEKSPICSVKSIAVQRNDLSFYDFEFSDLKQQQVKNIVKQLYQGEKN